MGAGATKAETTVEHVDVLIVGAGLSGIGAACQLRERFPERTLAILESRDATGGTWDLFRYPGVRSDSDMFTLGYRFRPWRDPKVLADGTSILEYVRETAREYGVDELVRLGQKVIAGNWSSDEQRWTVTIELAGGEQRQMSCSFLHLCTGYYNYAHGYEPEFPGRERFGGTIVHPQHWPEDLDYQGRSVVVIGSGATAVTLVPALADSGAGHVTMLQRSPTYILSVPATDPVAKVALGRLPERAGQEIVRWKNIGVSVALFQISQRAPRFVRGLIRRQNTAMLPDGYPVDTHFKPRYGPWDERLCLVPDGDLFRAIRHGRASVATGTIKTFTETGIELQSGEQLDADIIVTATGLELEVLGGAEFTVDGEPIDLPQTMGYKGAMLCGVPNAALVTGYTNASWTLKADLVSGYVCRLLAYMDEHGYAVATPRAPGPGVEPEPFLDLKSGYVQRALDRLPKQGSKAPWKLRQNYPRDVYVLGYGPVDDEMEFAGARRPAPVAAAV